MWTWHLLLCAALAPLVVLVHELGHALAGALVGFRFQLVQVGPVALLRGPEGLRLRWHQRVPGQVLGQQSSAPEDDRALPARLAVHGAGGPALNLLTAVLAWGAVAAAGQPSGPAGAAALGILEGLGALSVFGLVDLFPMRLRGQLSDGARIVHALRAARSPAGIALLRASMRQARALRPREWSLSARELAGLSETDARARDELLLFALGLANDQGDRALARELVERGGAIRDPSTQVEFGLQAAMLEALEGEPARARQRLEVVGGHPSLPEYSSLAHAAVLAAEGRAEEASRALERWERLVAALPPYVRVGNEWAEEAVRARLAPVADPGSDQAQGRTGVSWPR
ncbi:MAG TPA: hypothetical protein VMU15_01420 [Anaeromyxobacter sp.]|nr:hypothetical protein [Anaeromyxobacter sp.]